MNETTETWRPVVGWEGLYEASDQGRVRSLDRVIADNRKRRGIVRKSTRSGPYELIRLSRAGVATTFLVHRLIAAAFLGPCPRGMEVCHGPGGQYDNRVANLRYDTHLANIAETVRQGRHQSSQKTGCPAGHSYDGVDGRGYRICRTCRRQSERVRREAARVKVYEGLRTELPPEPICHR